MRTFLEYLADNHREILMDILSDLARFSIEDSWELGSNNQEMIQRNITRLKSILVDN